MDNRGYLWHNNNTILERKTKHTESTYEIDEYGNLMIEIRDDNKCIHTILHKDILLEIVEMVNKQNCKSE